MIAYIAMTVLGAALIVFGLKKSKIIVVAGAILAAAGLFLLICALLLLNSTANSEPKTGPEDDIVIDSGNNDVSNDNVTTGTDDGLYEEGSDWRTWRSYTSDYKISDSLTVCMAPYDDKKGFAVYDSSNGSRIGSLSVKNAGFDTEIKCEDTDGDGINELGFVVSSDETVWFAYNGSEWKEK